MASKKTNRSNGYQHLFNEQLSSDETLAKISESQGFVENYRTEDKEQLMDLRDALKKEYWRLAKDNLTERQFKVIELLARGYTQIEIAKQLNVNQSSITKSVNGNCDYRNGRKVYGGSRKKLNHLADNDPKIKAILKEMADIHSHYRY